jgi:hypothetical protein
MLLGMTHFYLSLRALEARSNLLIQKIASSPLQASRNDSLREVVILSAGVAMVSYPKGENPYDVANSIASS